jgi:dipeptidyl aminopeptidase/acylaminoacyl peptidase
MIVERTHYYARPGRASDVLATRRRASDVRTRLGLPRGVITLASGHEGGGPDVAWECAFESAERHAQDLEVRAVSPEFTAVRAEMGALLARFERHVWRVDEEMTGRPDGGTPVAAHAAVRPIVPRVVTFKGGGAAGLDLTGYLYLPPGTGPFPCVVTNHGSTIHQGTTDVCRPAMAAVLLSWGYASFLPHRAGYGNSPGVPWRQEVTGDFGTPEYDAQLARRLDRESDDVVAALDHLTGLAGIDARRVAVLGSSFGGTVSLLAAAKTDRFACAVDFAGAAMNWERTPTLRATMLDAARRLRVPIALIQAENDYSVAPTRELGAELERLGRPHESMVFPAFGLTPDEGHTFAGNGSMVWGPMVRAFLDRWLEAGT